MPSGALDKVLFVSRVFQMPQHLLPRYRLSSGLALVCFFILLGTTAFNVAFTLYNVRLLAQLLPSQKQYCASYLLPGVKKCSLLTVHSSVYRRRLPCATAYPLGVRRTRS